MDVGGGGQGEEGIVGKEGCSQDVTKGGPRGLEKSIRERRHRKEAD